jgi:cytochrome c oxidase subunit 2
VGPGIPPPRPTGRGRNDRSGNGRPGRPGRSGPSDRGDRGDLDGGGAPRRRAAQLVAVAPVVVVAGCGGDPPSMLDPASRASERVEWLWWVLLWTSVVAVGVVTAFLLVAVRRGRRPWPGRAAAEGAGQGQGEGRGEVAAEGAGAPPGGGLGEVDTRPVPWGGRFVVLGGVVVPGIVLAATFVITLVVLDDLAAPSEEGELTVQVVGRNWWWEVRYPNGAVTANEIHIPVDRPVEVELPSADVIHSFWVPQLQVKEDNMPGADNSLWLEARRPGRFLGQCAEFCGIQHANMRFQVEAMPAAEFEDWVADQARPADEPRDRAAQRGRDVLEASSCAGCHTVRGTSAQGDQGPDLTHLASRRTIGAGVAPLTRATLADFITNAQDAKPGAAMPPTELTPDQVDAVVAYLMELE